MAIDSKDLQWIQPANFLQESEEHASLVIGSRNGYRLFSLNNVDELELMYSNDAEETYMVERLFSSSLVATVSLSSPRKLKVCHFKKGTEICNYSYSNTILAVKMNRSRLVVCLEESLYIHNIKDMKVMHTIRDTPPNPRGLCALSINSDNCLLAYPGSAANGEVQIFDAMQLTAKTMIPAHDSPLAAIAFNASGEWIATASIKGTIIRVFSTHDGQKLFEYRRGVKRSVAISCLSFSICGMFLCASSNTETVHVFKFENPKDSSSGNSEDWMSWVSSYLPTQVTDVLTQIRSFATVHLPTFGLRNVASIVMVQNVLRVLVATEEAILYVYNLDPNEAGNLTLYKQHNLYDVKDGGRSTGISEPLDIEGGSAILGSYAGIVKGNPTGQMSGTESDKLREMAAATESPPKDAFHFHDDQEYPPLTQNSD